MKPIIYEWQDPRVTGRNRENAHAPLWAYADGEAAARFDRRGPYTMSLDGEWRFFLAPSPLETPSGFESVNFDDSGWHKLTVPGNWQLDPRINDKPIYTNQIFPFPPDPPFPPDDNPTGCYRRTFKLPEKWEGREIRIIFDSVDSAFTLWLNGEEVGYSTDSRLPAEFSLTRFLRPGINTLAVRVLRYSVGTYMEDQDYWQMSGIQRSVRLMAKPKAHIRDYSVRTLLDAEYRDAMLEVAVWIDTRELPWQMPFSHWRNFYPGLQASVRLLDASGRIVVKSEPQPFSAQGNVYGEVRYEKGCAHFSLAVSAPVKWSPEDPNLYTLVMTLSDDKGADLDFESCRVGFRQVEIRDRQVLLNGRRLIVRGVDRHEHHPDLGRVATEEHMRREIVQMKRLNFNAVRTSHYPDDPKWYELCDELGIMLVDEANLETHGLGSIITLDPAWAGAFLERAVRMVMRDRNHACVCFWSLGNESYSSGHHAAMANWIRLFDPTRPVQYENQNCDGLTTDIMTPMYPQLDWVQQVMENPGETRPMILCEYAYANGNATGNFWKFWEYVDRYPPFQGGFIWDWHDKLLTVQLEDGRRVLGYGNDFGENVDYLPYGEHGSQVYSGIVGAYLEPHPGAYEVQKIQSPVIFPAGQEIKDSVVVWNKHHSISLAHLELVWEVIEDGSSIRSGRQPMPDAAPGERAAVALPDGFAEPVDAGAERFLNVKAVLAADQPWAEAGHCVGWEQFLLSKGRILEKAAGGKLAGVSIEESKDAVEASGNGWILRWRRDDGCLVSWQRDGRELLAGPVREIFHRAPTDNDFRLGWSESYENRWEADGLYGLVRKVVKLEAKRGTDEVRVCCVCDLSGKSADKVIRSTLTAVVDAAGGVRFEHEAAVPEGILMVARIGLSLTLAAGYENVEWYGRGPWENYPDRKSAAMVGRWRSTVTRLFQDDYPVPGECGGRCDVRQLRLADAEGREFEVTGDPVFQFSALHFTPEDLRTACHAWELTPRAETTLILDGYHMGLGGDTGWSDNVHPEFLLGPGVYKWSLKIDGR